MRVGTWNLQRGQRSRRRFEAQIALLDALDLDIAVVTEPPAALLSMTGRVVASPAERPGGMGSEASVAILGRGIEPVAAQPPFERLSVAGRSECGAHDVFVYGSVLPWRTAAVHAPRLTVPGESFGEMFERLLLAQTRDVAALKAQHRDALVIWAGDFNQSLGGRNCVGSRRGRELLEGALDAVEFEAWNRAEAHAVDGIFAIDLICGPKGQAVKTVERIDPAPNGQRLSDHAGYVVELILTGR